MSGASLFVFTDLFWDQYADLRNKSNFDPMKAQLIKFLRHKHDSLNPMNHRDTMFTKKRGGPLAGVGHVAISRNPDTVLFYTVANETLYMAMLGNHHDYSNAGKHRNAAERTASKIFSAIKKGDHASPNFDTIKWQKPSDLIDRTELFELSEKAIMRIRSEVRSEIESGEIFMRINGRFFESLDEYKLWESEAVLAGDYIQHVIDNRPRRGMDLFHIWNNPPKFSQTTP